MYLKEEKTFTYTYTYSFTYTYTYTYTYTCTYTRTHAYLPCKYIDRTKPLSIVGQT